MTGLLPLKLSTFLCLLTNQATLISALPNKKMVTGTDILPLPHANMAIRKIKTKRSAVLTSSPFKNFFQSKLKATTAKKSETKETGIKMRVKSKKSAEKKRLSFTDECIFSGEPYENPPKYWIQCKSCKKWCHESCFSHNRFGKFK